MCGRLALGAALSLSLSCAGRFSRALPLLVEAEPLRAQQVDQASRLVERALPNGVRSAEIFFGAACLAARRGAPDLAFAHLESMQRAGIKDVAALEVSRDLQPLRDDARWTPLIARARATSQRSRDPDAAKIVTADVDRFWKAYDAAKNAANPREIYQREYVDRASAGLQSFFPAKIGTTENLIEHVRGYSRYYESVRRNTERVRDLEPAFRGIFHRLRDAVPDATFPDVTFVIGALSAGGSSTADGLIIGAEQNCRMADSPLEGMPLRQRQIISPWIGLPHVIAHELGHFQQHFSDDKSLLAAVLEEGGAELIAELVSGETANPALKPYGDAHERALWEELRAEMHATDEKIISRWVWGVNATADRPGDLGYYVGYRITRAYYEHHADKRRALRDILDITDANAFLAASGYAPR